MTNQDTPAIHTEEDEISLLDLLTTVAENLKLLVLGPLVVGVATLGVTFVLPQKYSSQAILVMPNQGSFTPAQTAALVSSPLVLDPILQAVQPLSDTSLDKARKRLEERVKATVGKDFLVRIETTGDTPQAAQQLGNQIIDSFLKNTIPTPADLQDIKRRLEIANSGLATVQGALKTLGSNALDKPLTLGTANTSLVSLYELEAKYLSDTLALPRAMLGLQRDAVVKQAPTLPIDPTSPKKGLVAIIAGLASGFALLLFVFARQSLRNASNNKETASKLASLHTSWRKALGKR